MTSPADWIVPRDIRSPGELADVITIVAQAVRDGDLRQVASGAVEYGVDVDVLAIAPKGPWPDYLELYFADTRTGKHFRLTAETYHGSGGSWSSVQVA